MSFIPSMTVAVFGFRSSTSQPSRFKALGAASPERPALKKLSRVSG